MPILRLPQNHDDQIERPRKLCIPKSRDHSHHFEIMKLGNLQRHAIISNIQIWKS